MGKYLILWEIDRTKIPVDRKERGQGWQLLMDMVRQDFEKGLTRDWGAFIGEVSGYTIAEGTELEVMQSLQQFIPYCFFKVHPIATENQVEEMIKSLSG